MAREPGGCEGRERTDVPVFEEDRARNSRNPRHAEAPLGHVPENMGAAQKAQVSARCRRNEFVNARRLYNKLRCYLSVCRSGNFAQGVAENLLPLISGAFVTMIE